MRRVITVLVAAGALGLAAAALASRPVAVLPSGDTVDLNTGIATTPAGTHYKVSPAELQTLRANVQGSEATGQPQNGDSGKPPSGNKGGSGPPR